MPRGGRRSSPEYLVTFSLRNACVTFYDDRYTRYRSSIVAMDTETEAVVHSFSEYNNGYQRLMNVRPLSLLRSNSPGAADRLARCARRPLGIGIPFSCNNIYHAAFHAVPAFERWRAAAAAVGASAALVDFVPIIFPSAAVGKKMSTDPKRWHAWEFSVRPFTTMSGERIAARTRQLVTGGAEPDFSDCTCYDTFHGNADAFNPIAYSAAPRMRAFRRAILANLPAAAHPFPAHLARAEHTTSTMLWAVRRHALRNIANEAHLAKTLAADAALSPRVVRVVLEAMPLGAQMRLLSRSSALIGVHGQAMTWVFFLPSESQRTAAIEIFPTGLVNPIYRELSISLGVRYEQLNAQPARGCKISGSAGANSKLSCNVTVKVPVVLDAVRRAAEWTRGA